MKNKFRILIADDFEKSLMEGLNQDHCEFVYSPEINRQQILETLHSFDGLVIRSKTRIDAEILDAGKKLVFIARGGSGMDNIDTFYAEQNNILCFNAGEANSIAVGEHTLGILLSLLHRITKSNTEVKNHLWLREENRGVELSGKTVGIIGLGNTGSAFAKFLSGFNVTMLAYDKYKSNYGNSYIKESTPEEIFENADILSLHIPLTSETRNLITENYIQQFKKPFLFLNTSRGEIVNTGDVLAALKNHKIIGFGADVLEKENFALYSNEEIKLFNQLSSLENVVLTPHIAGWTKESYSRISTVLASKINAITQKWKLGSFEVLELLKN